MIDLPPTAWLYQDVPLWALLVAMLTSPSRWTSFVTDALSRVRAGPNGGDARGS